MTEQDGTPEAPAGSATPGGRRRVRPLTVLFGAVVTVTVVVLVVIAVLLALGDGGDDADSRDAALDGGGRAGGAPGGPSAAAPATPTGPGPDVPAGQLVTSPGASTGLDGSLRDPALGVLPRPVAELLHDCREGDVTIEAVGGATDGEPAAATTSQVAAATTSQVAATSAAGAAGGTSGAAAPTGGDAGSTSAAPSSQIAATSAAPASGTARPRPAERTARAVQCTGRPGTALSDHVVRFIRDRDWADHRRDTFLTAAGPGAPGHGARGRAADGKVVQDDSSRWIAVRAHDQGEVSLVDRRRGIEVDFGIFDDARSAEAFARAVAASR
ncbi:hypothetical protein [Corynebacterium bovis]|uniref:Uncharacterized protein n=2 Tax=Corynebacterium bovis TaxID=36808 RepID=A0A426PYC2_9CORY|nr:hypothetical protein [Corynebacterium bovis]MDN8580150.1 hypothetical protein [Corynebacterium bovis]RRO86339.1 hypothetical protein CXF48_06905 [Corynebacterium bovis]